MKPLDILKIAGLLTLFVSLVVYIVARNGKPTIVTPVRAPLPAKNGYDLLTAATKKLAKEDFDDVFDKKPKHVWTLAEKRAALEKNQEALMLMKDSLRYPYLEENHRLSFNDKIGGYGEFRHMVRTIRLAGKVTWEEGKKRDAIGYYIDGITIGRRIPHRVGIEARDTGTVCEMMSRRDLWSDLEQLDASTAASALKRLEALDNEKLPLWASWEEEKYSAQSRVMQLAEHPEQVHFDDDENRADSEDRNEERGSSYFDIVPVKYVTDSIAAYYDQCIAQAKKPYSEGNKKIEEPKELMASTSVPLESPTKSRERYTTNNAGDALLRTALAIRVYRLRTGKLPADLNELVAAKLMRRVLDDPFAEPGKPLHYKPLADGKYLLYSIGPDGIDNQGKGIERQVENPRTHKRESLRFVNEDSKGDMVAGWYGY